MTMVSANRFAMLRDLAEARQRLAGAPFWLIRVEWWAERALRWGRSWYRRWALLRLAIAVSVIVPVGWTIWTYVQALVERERVNRITALTLVSSSVPKSHQTVKQALEFIIDRQISLASINWRNENLSRANLSGADLAQADLRGANLTNAELRGAHLSEANLGKADLRLANLRRADFCTAFISSARSTFSESGSTIIDESTIQNSNLKEANLKEANLSEACLIFVNLSLAQLSYANLRGADLSDANLTAAQFTFANLSEANLSQADLSEANLGQANLVGANLSETELSGAVYLTQDQLDTACGILPPNSLPDRLLWNGKPCPKKGF